MKRMLRQIRNVWNGISCRFALCMAFLLASGGCINEDLSVCERINISYRVQIVTTINTTIHSELTSTISEQRLGELLQEEFDQIFRDYAQDLDMLFYLKNGQLHTHDATMMNATNRTYELTIPNDNYDHVATANVGVEPDMTLSDDKDPATFSISQKKDDVIESHSTGIYSARKEIRKDLLDAEIEHHVNLYLVNSAVAVVIDPQGNAVDDVDMWVQGMATDFSVKDSVYSYNNPNQLTHGRRLKNDCGLLCNYVVCMPSFKDTTSTSTPATPSPIRATRAEEIDADTEGGEVWHFRLLTKMSNGITTQNTFKVQHPLPPGFIGIFKLRLKPDGTYGDDTESGVSVTLDWSEGSTYNPVI